MKNRTFFCLRGFMKSGTNWLGGLLDRHPAVSCRGEYHWQEILGPILKGFPAMTPMRDGDFRRNLIQQFRAAVKRSMVFGLPDEVRVVGDRTPTMVDPLILRAPHIVIIRDGRDVLVSRAFHLFNRPDVTGLFQRSPRMAESLRGFQEDKWFFKAHPERLLEDEELVKYTVRWWVEQLQSDRQSVGKHPQIPIKFVRYEDLLRDTQTITDDLFRFLGVDPEHAPLIEGNLTPGFSKEDPHRFFRKGEAGDWVNYFTDQTKEWFKEIGNGELISNGYVDNDSW